MKILLLGKNGQIGWELQRSLALIGEVIAPLKDDISLCANLAEPEKLRQTVIDVAPDVIVNAAAYTAVDKAESETDLAYLINSEAPRVLAQQAKQLDAWLVHYSTDYVFNGSGEVPWRESDVAKPLSVYGRSKYEGELAITESGCKHLILRTSWVYGWHGQNFLKTMLKLSVQRQQLTIVNDQIGAPTGAELLADATAHALLQALQGSVAFSGLYHLTASGQASWYEYATTVLELAAPFLPNKSLAAINPASSNDYPTAASRPHNSRLDTSLFSNTFGLFLPDWRLGVARVVAELLQTESPFVNQPAGKII